MNDKFLKPYSPQETEDKIYKLWEESGFFNPDNLPGDRAENYSIIMPPPNANGRLHAGHGTDMTLKDILIRYHRMKGKKALFLPGADHAGFETQGVFEKKLEKEGRSRFGMNNKELYDEIYEFVMENKHITEDDLRKLGVSCDWSRNTFTLQPDIVSRVQDTFIKMYKDKLVYRGKRSIHWNPKFKTSLSDIETTFEERKDPFYYFQYGPFVIGTARPETKFGDKYVVIHPNDERYKKYKHGDTFEAEWINGPIKATVIKDEVADMEMGTGAMTITPWHSQVDFELAQKYNLEMEQIIGWDGKLLKVAGEFEGLKAHIAREKVVEKLRQKGLLVKIDKDYTHAVRVCERTGVIVEPQIKDQWFVKMDKLSKMALDSLDRGEYKFLTKRYEKIFRHWMSNPQDWNISRQIVWGISIPAWFKNRGKENEEIIVSKEKPSGEFEIDGDTFDTWFSSGQWPLMTLGYPDGKDMEYYPTNVMETGADLVFKWIPRMIMFGLYLKGEVPFKDIYLHGMVLDAKSKKMSKSKGNVLSPVDLAEEFGTDATRMSFVVANPPGAEMPLSKDKIRAYKKFANKVWNIARFVLSNTEEVLLGERPELSIWSKEKLNNFERISKEITDEIEKYNLYLAAEKIYHFIWHDFADITLEESKELFGKDNSSAWTIRYIFENSIKLLHPFMPFITEEIWQNIYKGQKVLMIEEWPNKK